MGSGFAYLKLEAEQGGRWFSPSDSSDTQDTEDALSILRCRYARGEIDQTEFERRLNDLLETETPQQAEAYAEKAAIEERSR
ncbi:SHOCT domain-containing protein [Natrialba aegyptia]|uniref:SHOCT domain-containing protein n=1 Tax=Natrialba aegyptia DSM 13077 TaxID=1227491 RepID=M0AQ98_9EURY|nr:SHOCT domain-containing protein [Natrialba aegyptia]ELZ00725.1 hypothetical protein C480_18557 [Natrialba aegyptia DSM 13077]